MTAAGPAGGHVPVRLDAPELLGKPQGRREGHHLSALLVGVLLAAEATWWNDLVDPFGVVAWAAAHGLPYRRARRALDCLAESEIAVADLRPFRTGRVALTPRTVPTSLLHDRSRRAERFAPLSRAGLAEVVADHALSWVAASLLIVLLLLCDHRTAELPDGWTKTRLCEQFGIGWRRLTAGLEALAAAGLVTYEARRGGPLSLQLLARPALVVPTAPPQPRRRERRQIERQASHGDGPAADVARKLLAHYCVAAAPTSSLVGALGDALITGANPTTVLEHLAAMGSLGDARNVMAILVHRARRVAAELADAREREDRRRRAMENERRSLAERTSAEAKRLEDYQDEDRWLASVLDPIPSGTDLGMNPAVASRPVMVAAQIHTGCLELVARFPELDPTDLVHRWTIDLGSVDELDVFGIGPRSSSAGKPGRLPRIRAGPSLAERIRAENR